MRLIKKILCTTDDTAIILVRLMVGVVFLSEGIQKFLFPAIRGSGRFEKIGIPGHEFFGPFVGAFEAVCGILIVTGLFTRLAAVPTLIIMAVAISMTKIEIGIDEGFWQMMHDSRTDWAMLLGSVFLIVKGGGRYSVDKKLQERV